MLRPARTECGILIDNHFIPLVKLRPLQIIVEDAKYQRLFFVAVFL